MRRMRLTARVRVGTVDAPLLVVRLRVAPLLVVGPRQTQRFRRLHGRRPRFRERRADDLFRTTSASAANTTAANAGTAAAEPEGPHFLTDWITKVAGGKRHYVLRVPEVFVFLKTPGG